MVGLERTPKLETRRTSTEVQERGGKTSKILYRACWDILENTARRYGKGKKEHSPKENYLEIKYEDLCEDPVEVFKNAVEFAELKWDQKFEQTIKRHPWRSGNEKWKRGLTDPQKQMLEEVLRDHLKKYGLFLKRLVIIDNTISIALEG